METRNEIKKLCSYLQRVTAKIEKDTETLRTQMQAKLPTWGECEKLSEAVSLAEIIGIQVRNVEGLAKEYRFSFGTLYRCKQTDPLGVIKEGNLYRLRKWNGEYIVCGEGFAIQPKAMPEYFERVEEEDEQQNSSIVNP